MAINARGDIAGFAGKLVDGAGKSRTAVWCALRRWTFWYRQQASKNALYFN
jgi:hypothetical protein